MSTTHQSNSSNMSSSSRSLSSSSSSSNETKGAKPKGQNNEEDEMFGALDRVSLEPDTTDQRLQAVYDLLILQYTTRKKQHEARLNVTKAMTLQQAVLSPLCNGAGLK